MKLGQAASRQRGSFGIPPEIHPEAVAQKKAERAPAATSPAVSEDSGFDVDGDDEGEGDGEGGEGEASKEDAAAEKKPLQLLADIGVKISADDWSDLFFRGSLEKTIHVADMPQEDGTVKPFSVTVKTLIGAEYDDADGLLADEIRDLSMTRDGMETRRQMWIFAFAIQKVNGRALCKPVTKVDPATKQVLPDPKGTAKAKRTVLSQMSPLVIRMALDKYWIFLEQMNALAANPKKNFFEKP